MRLLVLGGTKFLGRATVSAALDRGDAVTIFTRGHTNPGLFPKAEHLVGDRDGDLSALHGREWDVVIDTCGYVPRVVRASANLLADSVGTYVFVSSGSVYPVGTPPAQDESAPTERLDEPESEEVEKHYGALKAACEREVETRFPGRSIAVRAGLIVGPHDPTGRFTYWVHRIDRGGMVLAPEPRDAPVQFVDVRDLAEWMLDASERSVTGTFNATGPVAPTSMQQLLESIRDATASDARFEWVEERFLLDRGIAPWSDLPLWLAPASNPGYAGFLAMDIRRALESGLTFRPVGETVRATLELASATDDAGLTPEREKELLDAWLS